MKLLGATALDLYFALGWPLLLLVIGSLLYGLVRMPKKTAFCLLPLLSYQFIVIAAIRFTMPRFFMPGFVGLALLAGAGAAALLRSRLLPAPASLAAVAFVFAATFLYGLGSSLEIARDSRVRAVEWLAQNVDDPRTPIATLLIRWYSPYPPNAGFHNFAYPWKPPPDPAAVSPAALPPYVISGSSWQMSRAANRFVNAMSEGTLPYRKAATLRQRLFYPNKTPFGFAGWPVVRQRQSSPEITIWARSDL